MEGAYSSCKNSSASRDCWAYLKEEPMDSKPSSRRDVLKGGALAVGAVATGASVGTLGSGAVTPALSETPATGSAAAATSYLANEAPMGPSTDETIAYGLRSHYV